MARYNNRHNILISDTIEILRDELRRDVFDGAEVGTRIRLSSVSGVIDEFTEEVTYTGSITWANVSGIVDIIGEKDELLGINGRVKVGDTSVIYHYNTISGVFLQNYIDEIELLVPGISGLHHVAGYRVSELAGEPLYLKMALNLMTPRLVGSNFVIPTPPPEPPAPENTLEQQVAALFASGEQGAWYDPSAANVTWRRNLLIRTEELDNAIWNLLGSATRSANYAQAPDGSMTAERVQFTANVGDQIQQLFVYNSGGGLSYTGSIYIKSNTASSYSLRLKNTHAAVVDNFQNITVTPEWQRFVFTVNNGAANGTGQYLGVAQIAAPTVGADISVWGAQLEFGTTATAYQRIVTPEITYLSTVQAQPLLFQNAEGTLPVTEVEQPVGLILDKRKGATLGAELVDTANTAAGWTAVVGAPTISQDGDAVKIVGTGAGQIAQANLSASWGLTTDVSTTKFYAISFEVKVASGNSVVVGFVNQTIGTGSTTHTSTTYLSYFNYVLPANTGLAIRVSGIDNAEEIWVRNISVKLLDGNHAYQTGSTARPVLRARYNLLTYSEQFGNAGAWTTRASTVVANTTTAPDGTNTADSMLETITNDVHRVTQTVSVVSGAVYRLSCYIKPNGRDWALLQFSVGATNAYAYFDVATGSVGIVGAGASNASITRNPTTGWCLCQITATTTATSAGFAVDVRTGDGGLAYFGDITKGLYIWGADLRVGTSAGDYQRIEAAPTAGGGAVTYATTSTITGQPFRPYLHFDGADGLLTANVDFTSTDAVSMCMGEQQLGAYAAVEVGFELSNNSGSSGTFAYFSEFSPTPIFRSNGGTQANATAPSSSLLARVASGRADISDDVCILRINGAQVASVTTDQGAAASYVNQPLYIGSRSGIQFPMSGNIYGLLVRGGSSTTDNLQTMETYMAGKTGVTL